MHGPTTVFAAVVSAAGLCTIAGFAVQEYWECCGAFITAMVLLFVYNGAENVLGIGDDKENPKAPKARDGFACTVCRFALLVALVVLLPSTGDCDGDHKHWSLVVLIVLASFYEIFEGLFTVYRFLSWIARRRGNSGRQ